eukprot:462816-Lingulodinium_polyedra.AAC.1
MHAHLHNTDKTYMWRKCKLSSTHLGRSLFSFSRGLNQPMHSLLELQSTTLAQSMVAARRLQPGTITDLAFQGQHSSLN